MQMIAEIYGILRDGLGMSAKEIGADLRRLEQGPAQLLSDRDHRQGACRRRPEDRQADGRHDPRPRRPEGHRQMVGDRGADSWACRRPRSKRRSPPAPVVDEGRARSRREGLSARRHETRDRSQADAAASDLELALFAGKIAAYAQGFAVMDGGVEGVRLEPAAADHRQDLARRLHHPLAVPRQDRGGLRQGADARQSADGAGLHRR